MRRRTAAAGTAPSPSRRFRGRLTGGALVLSLAFAALPGVAVPAGAQERSAPAAVVQPAWPLTRFPAQVAQACEIWDDLAWPGTRKPEDYVTPDGEYIRGGNPYGNRSGDLPAQDTYREYDVNPRPTAKTHRDAERIVRDQVTDQVWYSDDHYANFREIEGGC